MFMAAAFLFSLGFLALGLGFYTVRGLLRRRGEALVEIAVGMFRIKFSAKVDADRDDPEVVAAPADQEQLEQAPPAPSEKGGGGT
ncbi:hypothetical protein AB0J83_25640 [Actinoplanes sp. NPDC049596]|uniref:hypothetical protein n=1 Tax=unclassified Actinoplanes TaxID=2626549 RepID=UPI0034341AE8